MKHMCIKAREPKHYINSHYRRKPIDKTLQRLKYFGDVDFRNKQKKTKPSTADLPNIWAK